MDMMKYLTVPYYAQSSLVSKNLSGAEWHYSNKQQEALRILHGLEKFHH